MSIFATLSSLPIRYKFLAALAVAVAALLVAGVPLSTFVPFAGMDGVPWNALLDGSR